MPSLEQFNQFDIRIGTVAAAQLHPSARKPSYQMQIDFGPLGVKRSSAQLTHRYEPADLVNRQVVAVVNFPPRRIAGFVSEVLVLGAMLSNNDVALLDLTDPVPNGTRVG
jgi:tRNA-binding protein